MSLIDEITKIILQSKHAEGDHDDQLTMLEKVENVLKKLEISLETKFEIPLSRRIVPFKNEKNA